MIDFNPLLAAARHATEDKGSPDGIENPDTVQNIAWQTRAAPPSAAEEALADALEAIFAEGIGELPEVVARLNAVGLAPPVGATQWTEESFCTELRRLGR